MSLFLKNESSKIFGANWLKINETEGGKYIKLINDLKNYFSTDNAKSNKCAIIYKSGGKYSEFSAVGLYDSVFDALNDATPLIYIDPDKAGGPVSIINSGKKIGDDKVSELLSLCIDEADMENVLHIFDEYKIRKIHQSGKLITLQEGHIQYGIGMTTALQESMTVLLFNALKNESDWESEYTNIMNSIVDEDLNTKKFKNWWNCWKTQLRILFEKLGSNKNDWRAVRYGQTRTQLTKQVSVETLNLLKKNNIIDDTSENPDNVVNGAKDDDVVKKYTEYIDNLNAQHESVMGKRVKDKIDTSDIILYNKNKIDEFLNSKPSKDDYTNFLYTETNGSKNSYIMGVSLKLVGKDAEFDYSLDRECESVESVDEFILPNEKSATYSVLFTATFSNGSKHKLNFMFRDFSGGKSDRLYLELHEIGNAKHALGKSPANIVSSFISKKHISNEINKLFMDRNPKVNAVHIKQMMQLHEVLKDKDEYAKSVLKTLVNAAISVGEGCMPYYIIH